MGSIANQVRTKGDIQQIFKKILFFSSLEVASPLER
jgi:hypothetical protein